MGVNRVEVASVDCNTVVTYVPEQYLKTKQRVTSEAKTVEEGKTAGGEREQGEDSPK